MPVQYFNCPIVAAAPSSYSSSPTPVRRFCSQFSRCCLAWTLHSALQCVCEGNRPYRFCLHRKPPRNCRRAVFRHREKHKPYGNFKIQALSTSKIDGIWRYGNAASRDNGKIKPDIVLVNAGEGRLEKHAEGPTHVPTFRRPCLPSFFTFSSCRAESQWRRRASRNALRAQFGLAKPTKYR